MSSMRLRTVLSYQSMGAGRQAVDSSHTPDIHMGARILWTLIAVFVVALDAGYGQVSTAREDQTEEQQVLATEDAYVEAEVNRDEETLRRIVDDRFVFNQSNGTTIGKEALIASVMKMNMSGQNIGERSVLVEGDIALVFGTAALEFPRPGGEVSVSRLRYTATYVNRRGEWKMLALQMQERAAD